MGGEDAHVYMYDITNRKRGPVVVTQLQVCIAVSVNDRHHPQEHRLVLVTQLQLHGGSRCLLLSCL